MEWLNQYAELIGLLATLLVLIPIIFSQNRKVQNLYFVGAPLFMFYAMLIGSDSLYVFSMSLLIIYAYKLYKRRHQQQTVIRPKAVYTHNNKKIQYLMEELNNDTQT